MSTTRLSGLAALKKKREEVVGSQDAFVWRVDPNIEDSQQFTIRDPRLLDIADKDEYTSLNYGLQNGSVLPSEYQERLLELLLDDEQIDDFVEAVDEVGDPAEVLNLIIKEYLDKVGPTRRKKTSTGKQ